MKSAIRRAAWRVVSRFPSRQRDAFFVKAILLTFAAGVASATFSLEAWYATSMVAFLVAGVWVGVDDVRKNGF